MKPDRLYSIVIAPHVSEKSSLMTGQSNHHAFQVATDATKAEIRQAIETIFDVEVEDLQVLNVKGKTRLSRRGRKVSRGKTWKKAYIRLAAGNSIDLTELG